MVPQALSHNCEKVASSEEDVIKVMDGVIMVGKLYGREWTHVYYGPEDENVYQNGEYFLHRTSDRIYILYKLKK